mmetsp:Transcript_13184/g.21237  ORF Transcript_13184/g.21237 Transcript_13184/m.21237 type:complete len:88 (-) Transcript_13184:382-645(-)
MSEEKPTEEHRGIVDTIKDVGHNVGDTLKDVGKKVVDATILNTHPSGAPIDHTVQLDGQFAKDVVDATVLNDHPSGAPVGTCRPCLV